MGSLSARSARSCWPSRCSCRGTASASPARHRARPAGRQPGGRAVRQRHAAELHGLAARNLSGLAGHEFVSLSAHQALKTLNVVLLITAGLGCVIALFALAGPTSGDANRGSLALLGAIAAACVLYRMVEPPSPSGDLLPLSLREGAWLSLLGASGDGRRRAVARPARRRRRAPDRHAGRLVAAVWLDARDLSTAGRRGRPMTRRTWVQRPVQTWRGVRLRYPGSNPC